MANTYFQMLQAVENYYGAGSDQWVTMANWTGYQSAEVAAILRQTPGVNTIVNESGELIGYSLETAATSMTTAEAAAASAANVINSNAITAEAVTESIAIPANATAGATAGTVEIASGATKVATASKVATAASHIGTWVLGAGVGMKLGVWIDGGLYNLNPDFWDAHNMEYLNPEKWTESKVTNWLYDYSGYDDFLAMFNADDHQLYVDENLYALAAQYLASQGFFNQSAYPYVILDDTSVLKYPSGAHQPIYYTNSLEGSLGTGETYTINPDGSAPVASLRLNVSVSGTDTHQLYFASEEHFTVTQSGTTRQPTQYTTNDKTYWCLEYSVMWNDAASAPLNSYTYVGSGWQSDIAYIIFEGTVHEPLIIEGTHPYAQMPVGITDQMTPADIIALLKQQYPHMWDDAIKQGVLNDDGTITDKIYIPIAVPDGGTEGQPTTSTDHPSQVDPDNPTQTQIMTKAMQPTPNPPTEPQYPDTGTGNTPAIALPTGSADALYKIYNPTNAQIQQFGAWLWSSNFVDQLLKIFNDPMQAIISLHKIYATPHIGGNTTIKVGYLDSQVPSAWVDQQYITVDCGSINLLEQSASVLDYAPFVELRLYLPFIGIVSLDTADAMRGNINVKYNIDVITGTVVAMVNITRDGGAGGVLYQYTGSMAENYPLSSGSYMGIITGILGIAAGVAGTVASGGAAAPILLGSAAGVTAMHTKIEHSNGFSGNAGALGCKKPYLIISRQQNAMAGNLAGLTGWPANAFVKLSQCNGLTKVKDINLSVSGATDAELQQIETLLKSGVII